MHRRLGHSRGEELNMETMKGKVVLITGGNSGIGLEAAVKIAKLGAELVLVARDKTKGDAAVADVKQRGGNDAVSLLLCDFSDQASIRKLAEEFRAGHDRLDLLINNAGSVSDSRKLTSDGIEQTFAVNHLGYFLLTNLLLDLIEKSAPARIVNVSSVGHYSGDMDFENLQYEKGGYFIMRAYNRSKLGNVLFTTELARRMEGKNVTVNCLHPGAVRTNIWSHAPWYSKPFLAIMKLFMISAEEGGDRIFHLAASDDVTGQTGGYYDKRKKKEPSALAQDAALAKRLWETSAQMVKLA
jgi:NAD(P)-dependent dehydrogenase (short-subunit alcohol dehydrogenase family)